MIPLQNKIKTIHPIIFSILFETIQYIISSVVYNIVLNSSSVFNNETNLMLWCIFGIWFDSFSAEAGASPLEYPDLIKTLDWRKLSLMD